MNQGIEWVLFEVLKNKYRYYSSSPNEIELLDVSNNKIKTYNVSKKIEQCRPGGKEAEVYEFENGDRVCLYW